MGKKTFRYVVGGITRRANEEKKNVVSLFNMFDAFVKSAIKLVKK